MFRQNDTAKISKKKSCRFPVFQEVTVVEICGVRYIIDRLPEGGEGLHGYDDGEGDD